MTSLTAKQMAREVGMVSPDEPIGRAVEVLRMSNSPSVPVGADGFVSGLLSEADLFPGIPAFHDAFGLSDALSVHPDGLSGKGEPLKVRDVMRLSPVPVPEHLSVEDLVEVFTRNPAPAIPVVDEMGFYQGMVTRTDVASAHYRSARPRAIGGLATPLGVFLTTGTVTAGAGNFALMLTGALMVLAMGVTRALLFGVTFLLDDVFGNRWSDILLSPYVAGMRGHTEIIVSHLLGLFELIGFLLLLRILPLSGFHAAEHQTVHAIERGKPLEISVVRTMPRPHPRCGTNLVAFLLLMQILMQWIPVSQTMLKKSLPDSWLVGLLTAQDTMTVFAIAALVTFFCWRFLGMKLQFYFTTKPATDRQLLSGISAGKELLEKYQDHVGERPVLWRKVWNMGLPQVIAGGAATYWLGRALALVWEWLVVRG